MATVNKDFRVKSGLVVEGSTGTINGSNILTEASTTFLSEYVADTVGAMVTSNTESGIAVTYDDTDNTLDFNVSDFTITLGGDLSGSVTITDLANATLTASIAANSVALGTDTTGDYVASVSGSDGVTITGTGEGAAVSIANSDKGSSQNIFKNVAVTGQTTVVADSNDDTLTLAGSGITITTNASTDTVTFTNAGVTSITGTTNEVEVSASTGSITIGLPNDVTIGNNLVVTGNLTVQGDTTTLNTATLAVEDNLIVLNSNVTGSPSLDAGLEVERGTSTNAKLYWNETADKWYVDNGTGSGTEIALVGSATFNTFTSFTDGTNTAAADSASDTFTFTSGTGISAVVSAAGDSLTITNSGVTSLTGTTNQVSVSASTGGVTLSLPQSIGTSSTPTFGSVTATNSLTTASVILTDGQVGTATATVGTSAAAVDTFAASTYTSAKYFIQMKNGTDIHVIEALVTIDGSNNVYITEYGEVISNASLGTVDADYSAPNVRLLVTGASASTVVKVVRTLIEA